MSRQRDVPARLAEYVTPLDTTDPAAPLDDLQGLRSLFSDAALVGLGEATHGTREFFQLKHRLLRFLVEDLDYRVFLMEANFSETLALDDYVVRGEGDPRDALDDIYFWTWDTEEVLALVEWLRDFNDGRPRDDRVRFFGVDVQYLQGAAAALDDYLAAVDPDVHDDVADQLASFAADGVLRDADDREDRIEDAAALHDRLAARFDAREDEYVAASSRREYDLARQHLRSFEQAVALKRVRDEDDPEPGVRLRDESMAENAAWALDYLPHDRAALWAHDAHLMRGTMTGDWGEATAMGRHLADEYGDAYVAVRFDFGRGGFQARDDEDFELREFTLDGPPADSGTATLASLGRDQFVLDVAAAREDDALGEWLATEREFRSIGAVYDPTGESFPPNSPSALADEFDALVYVDETTRAVPVERED